MDIVFYCVAFCVALFGKPKHIQATATLLESGVDGCGSVLLDYEGVSVTIEHSKISRSYVSSEIQGEDGAIIIDQISLLENVRLHQRNGGHEKLLAHSSKNSMEKEAISFAKLIHYNQIDKTLTLRSQITAQTITKIRMLTHVHFPSDSHTI